MIAKRSRIRWRSSWRIIPSRFPPVGVFDRVADPADLEAVLAIESLTNDRLRQQVGDIGLVPADQRISGPGTSTIMAAFTHLNPEGSRFSDGSYGVYYAARSLQSALAETVFHRERFMSATRQSPTEIQMRSYSAAIDASLHDVRGLQVERPELYSADVTQYAPAQAFARELRASGSSGVVYSSVRDAGGECVAVFRPDVVAPAVQGAHYRYVWDGSRISDTLLVQRAG